jgi:putative toxin-antitoxin system antitoxin component (TIGR02293 family)
MDELRRSAELLGISLPAGAKASDVTYLDFIRRGLPTHALERISKIVAPSDARFKYRIVPRARLTRYVKGRRRLCATESVLMMRLASVWTFSIRIWKSQEVNREFLFRPHPVFDGQRPLDLVLANEFGADLVRRELGRLEAGTAV